MRVLLLATLSLAAPAPAALAAEPLHPVPDAPARYAPGSPAMVTAVQIGIARWGLQPCGGQVTFGWHPLGPRTNAASTWTNPVSAYGAPEHNTSCSVAFSATARFDWPKFCTITVHELGHLAGRPHSDRHDDIMAAYYDAADPRCAATPDPTAYVPPGHGSVAPAGVVRVVRASRDGRATAAARRR